MTGLVVFGKQFLKESENIQKRIFWTSELKWNVLENFVLIDTIHVDKHGGSIMVNYHQQEEETKGNIDIIFYL